MDLLKSLILTVFLLIPLIVYGGKKDKKKIEVFELNYSRELANGMKSEFKLYYFEDSILFLEEGSKNQVYLQKKDNNFLLTVFPSGETSKISFKINETDKKSFSKNQKTHKKGKYNCKKLSYTNKNGRRESWIGEIEPLSIDMIKNYQDFNTILAETRPSSIYKNKKLPFLCESSTKTEKISFSTKLIGVKRIEVNEELLNKKKKISNFKSEEVKNCSKIQECRHIYVLF